MGGSISHNADLEGGTYLLVEVGGPISHLFVGFSEKVEIIAALPEVSASGKKHC